MTHEDSGKYAAKHPKENTLNKKIAEAIRKMSPGGTLACGSAEKISGDLQFEIAQVGITADLLEVKIDKCQLGLFGWGQKPNHGKDIPAIDTVSGKIKNALDAAAENGAVTCASLWRIADQLGVNRKTVSATCDALKLKIRQCQLGAF
ncbi:MAG: hypothetical protein Q8P24_12455 [Desulfobacterales bacterium]|nr:hypothetical protein [Desulfobacterales bacterium]